MVIARPDAVQLWVALLHLIRALEETLRRDGKKLGLVRGAVTVQKRAMTMLAIVYQPFVRVSQYSLPMRELILGVQWRTAVGGVAVLHVQLMSEFVQNEIVSIVFLTCSQ